ncbi:hypothetical protein [Micromonospora rubida]|uniref:hypothetical protein n=1 Tax=Micromonospora rubida TaxID=2697657 RepID=UPI001377681E|nr:hypothetical protein [Micromonospora rubida]NBE85365.1 hypothetical protein [Micromonospora rubida]
MRITGWSVHGLCVHELDEAAEPPAADDTRPGHPAALVRQVADRLRGGLPPTPARNPSGGWLFLGWGQSVALDRVPGPALLSRLAALRSFGHLPSAPATPPAWDLHRPRDWPARDGTRRLIEDTLAPGRVAEALR